MKIAICAGHHEDAKGAENTRYNLNEYDEACKIIPFLETELIAMGHSISILSGRLGSKVRKINAGNFDLALDLHFNADYDHLDPDDLDDERGHGCMVMYCPKAFNYGDAEPQSTRRSQANQMSAAMSGVIENRNLGGRPGWYWGNNPPEKKDYFLRKTNCTAFIPEFGYIDNNGFASTWLVDAERHAKSAQAVAEGEKVGIVRHAKLAHAVAKGVGAAFSKQ